MKYVWVSKIDDSTIDVYCDSSNESIDKIHQFAENIYLSNIDRFFLCWYPALELGVIPIEAFKDDVQNSILDVF